MSQLIDHHFVIEGNEKALEEVQDKLAELVMKNPGEDGIMEWGDFERTAGCIEFHLMDSHYFETTVLTPTLLKWSAAIDVVITCYCYTEDGDLAAWAVRIESEKDECIGDWDWPHPSYIQRLLLSFEDEPSPEMAAKLISEMPAFLCGGTGWESSGVGIAEVLVAAFREFPEYLEDATVQTALLEIEEREWSEEDIEDDLNLDDPQRIEPLLQFYHIRAAGLMH